MKTIKKIATLSLFATFLGLTSCLDDDGNPTTALNPCTDTTYYALMSEDQDNTDGIIEFIENTNNSIISTNYVTNTVQDFPTNVTNTNGTWNKVMDRLFWLDELNREYAMTYDPGVNTANIHSMTGLTTGKLSAPVYDQNKLYVLDFAASGDIEIKLLSSDLATLSGGFIPIIPATAAAGYNNTIDVQGNTAYGATNENGKLYFLIGDTVVCHDLSAPITGPYPAPYDVYTINQPGDYYDIAYRQNGNLISIRLFNNQLDIVELDISTPGVANVITKFSNINANPESLQVVYKECGDRLQVLTHFTFFGPGNMSRVIEANLSNNGIAQKDFPNFIFGLVHDQQ